VLDLNVSATALLSPRAPSVHRFPSGIEPVLMAHGELDGDARTIEIAAFELSGASHCLRIVKETAAIETCR
jgi:hypothetical protein